MPCASQVPHKCGNDKGRKPKRVHLIDRERTRRRQVKFGPDLRSGLLQFNWTLCGLLLSLIHCFRSIHSSRSNPRLRQSSYSKLQYACLGLKKPSLPIPKRPTPVLFISSSRKFLEVSSQRNLVLMEHGEKNS